MLYSDSISAYTLRKMRSKYGNDEEFGEVKIEDAVDARGTLK
jgi:hypothetical protein